MFRRGAVAVAAYAMALGACSSAPSDTPEGAETVVESSTVTATPSKNPDPRDPEEILQGAIDPILREGVTDFRYEWALQDQPIIVVEGFADLDDGWRATATLLDIDSDETRTMHVKSLLDVAWMQMTDWPEGVRGCWLELSPTQAPLGVQGLSGPEPGYISLLGSLRANGFFSYTSEDLSGFLELRAALILLQAQTLNAIELGDAQKSQREVPVRITPGEEGPLELSVLGRSLTTGIENAGGSIAPKIERLLAGSTLTVTYPENTSPDRALTAPADNLVMTDEFGCGRLT